MTGCLGSEDILFTIMSVHATDSPYFEWTKEGEVNAIDLEQIVSGNRKSFNLESWLGHGGISKIFFLDHFSP